MNCPKCSESLEAVDFRGIEVDRCTGCHGIFFDAGEDIVLKDMVASELIDTGSKRVGEAFDEMRKINCPRCNAQMISLEDTEQRHIRYEVCRDCFGIFLDAGEFEDLKDFSLVERIKNVLKG
jgi:Zn-finger nucleic acid-binding protein